MSVLLLVRIESTAELEDKLWMYFYNLKND